MGYFYEGIDQGLSLTKALQKAKLQYLETADITLRDPVYWAGFHLTGYSDTIELKESSDNMLLLFIGAGVFMGMIILLGIRLYLKRKLQ